MKIKLNLPQKQPEPQEEKYHLRTERNMTFTPKGETIMKTTIIVNDVVVKEVEDELSDEEVRKIAEDYLDGKIQSNEEFLTNDINELPVDTDQIFYTHDEEGNKISFIRKTCPCCGQIINLEIDPIVLNINQIDYIGVINDTENFFNLVQRCPNCNYVMVFDSEITDKEREFVQSEYYNHIINNTSLEPGFLNWILYAILCENSGKHREAAIGYIKAYDYLEIKHMELDEQLIEKAASNFLISFDETTNTLDAIFGIESCRRAEYFDKAKKIIDDVLSIIGNITDVAAYETIIDLLQMEFDAISLEKTEKLYLNI